MTDQGAATAQVPYEPGRCECAHLVTFHVINGKGQRGKCSACVPCRRYVAKVVVSRG